MDDVEASTIGSDRDRDLSAESGSQFREQVFPADAAPASEIRYPIRAWRLATIDGPRLAAQKEDGLIFSAESIGGMVSRAVGAEGSR